MPTKERVPWNLDLKLEKGDVIGANVIKNGLAKLFKGAWLDKRTGRRVSQQKVPQDVAFSNVECL